MVQRSTVTCVDPDPISLGFNRQRGFCNQFTADDRLLKKFEDQHGATAALELVGASSCYNMVSRFLIFTHVEPETEFSQAAADIVQAFRTRL